MHPPSLTLIAGPAARQKLLDEGLRQENFRVMVAASGGPKWFVLKALDQYLFGEFFKDRQTPLATLGTSAGAWQMACFSQKNPVEAVERLARFYSTATYSEKPDIREISASAEAMVDVLLDQDGARQICSNPMIQTHIIINRCRGLVGSDRPSLQLLGLALAAASNAASRKRLGWFFERVVMHAGESSFFDLSGFNTRYGKLQPDNVRASLLATGSIPMVLEGIRNVPGAPLGTYRDGGITDYHFDIPFCPSEQGLVLYPHFSQRVTAGWFDKSLTWRKVNAAYYDNVLLLTPSRSFVESLPFSKIPDRKDFEKMDTDTRLKAWAKVLSVCHRLADDFDRLLGRPLSEVDVRPFA